MKKIFTILFMAALTLTAMGQTPGYALYGDVPTGYTDLTSYVQVVAPATISGQNLSSTDHVAPAAEGIAFTGRGHSAHYCQGSADLSIRFSEDQSLTLTNKYAIHIKIKRTNAGSGDIQMSFIKGSWGSYRTGFLMEGSAITDDEDEIVLKYSDHKEPAGGQYYSDKAAQFIGTDVVFAGGGTNELFRMTAANGEAFLITGIYLEAERSAEPKPELVGEHRYYLYRGGDLPANVENELTCYDERENLTIVRNGVAVDANQTLFHRENVSQSWFAFDTKMTSTVENPIDNDDWYLVVRFRSNLEDGALGYNNFRINLSNNAQSFILNNGTPFGEIYNNGFWKTVSFKLSDATGTKPATYLQANEIAVQFHLNGGGNNGKFFDLDYVYFTNNITNLDPGFCEDNEIVTSDNDFYTFYADEEVAIPSGVTVYTAALNNDQTALQLTEINGNIPAKTGVLVKTSSTGTFVLAATSTGATATSDLSGVSVATTFDELTDGSDVIYTLGEENGEVCFIQADRGTLKAHRAYLRLPAGAPAPASVRISAEENTATSLSADPMVTSVPTKRLVNGQILIEKDGALYYVTGMRAN